MSYLIHLNTAFLEATTQIPIVTDRHKKRETYPTVPYVSVANNMKNKTMIIPNRLITMNKK